MNMFTFSNFYDMIEEQFTNEHVQFNKELLQMSIVIITYTAYMIVSTALTVWVAQTLFKNGRVFLVDVFAGNEDLADSVNRLLVVGFYLINLGYIALALKIEGEIPDARAGVEALATKLGIVMLVLGAMHFTNMIIFAKVRAGQMVNRRNQAWIDAQRSVPPVAH